MDGHGSEGVERSVESVEVAVWAARSGSTLSEKWFQPLHLDTMSASKQLDRLQILARRLDEEFRI